jgi:hypothetical protein
MESTGCTSFLRAFVRIIIMRMEAVQIGKELISGHYKRALILLGINYEKGAEEKDHLESVRR